MSSWPRISLVLGLFALLAWCLAPAGPLAGATSASAAEDEETTTTPLEELPPVVETPPIETPPVVTPPLPVETPVTTTPSETVAPATGTTGTTTPVESTRSTGSTSSGSGTSSGGGGGGSTTTSGSTGTAGTTATSPGTTTPHRSSPVRSGPTHSSGGGGAGSKQGGGRGAANGNAAIDGSGSGAGSSHHSGSSSGGGGGGSQASAPQPSFSPQSFDEGATAVSNVASHVGEAFAEALPTAPLEKIGTRLGAHVGLLPAQGGIAQKHAVDRLGTAIGAALIGSAVAVERKPVSKPGPIPFIDAPGGESGLVYVLAILALLAGVALLIAREIRSGLGHGGRRERVSVAGSAIGEKLGTGRAFARAREFGDRGSRRLRRFSADAAAGFRSLL